MNIRLERPEDYRVVEELTREAFWNVYRPGCLEHYVLNRYRNNPDFIPELDYVMEEDGRIIGHVMFSKAELVLADGTHKPSWTFGPISIHPDYKRKGYGLKLLNYALDKARDMGVGFICMEGNIDFYKNAGFGLASKLGIHYHSEPKDAEVPYFLAQELIPGWLGGIEATYCPPQGYFVADANPDAFEAYDATFPKKEKAFCEGQLPQFCDDIIRAVKGEADAQAVYREVKQTCDFAGFARRFMHSDDGRVARNAFWVLTKATDQELSQLQGMLNELMDLAINTEHSAVRRLSLNIIERLKMEEDDLRTDFLDFCLEHMADADELPGIQSISMKLAYRMCKFYPELMDEFKATLESMETEYYKPAVNCVRSRILRGKLS